MHRESRFSEFRKRIAPQMQEVAFMLKRMSKSPLSITGLSIVIFFAAIAILAPVLAPPLPGKNPFMIPQPIPYAQQPQPPSTTYPFGTAQNEFDLYYGMVWGTITAFRLGLTVVGVSLAIGLLFGVVAGYYGGGIDELMMRFTDVIFAFPGLILAMALAIAIPTRTPITIANLGFTTLSVTLTGLDVVTIALVLVGWPGYTRLIRGEILRVKTEDYVEAAKAVGCSDSRVIARHILPNAVYPLLIVATLDIGAMVLVAAALGFLGIGAEEGFADWGRLISTSRTWIYAGRGSDAFKYWYTFLIPGLFIFTFTLGWNLLGDAFRDILDPMLRRR
jgi:peptide/nickel transport system permease protein